MKPNPRMKVAALVLVIVGLVFLFGSLLWETWNARSEVKVDGIQASVTPILAGVLGLMLALSLGVEARGDSGGGFFGRLRRLFAVDRLLTAGALLYGLGAVAGGFVWWKRGDEITPELVETVVLVTVGYAAAAAAALARP